MPRFIVSSVTTSHILHVDTTRHAELSWNHTCCCHNVFGQAGGGVMVPQGRHPSEGLGLSRSRSTLWLPTICWMKLKLVHSLFSSPSWALLQFCLLQHAVLQLTISRNLLGSLLRSRNSDTVL